MTMLCRTLIAAMVLTAATSYAETGPLLFHASFDEAAVADRAAGRTEPWQNRETEIVPGRFGGAVQLGEGRPSLIFDGPENVLAGRGTVSVWFRLPDRPGPLDVKRILYVQARERGHWCLFATMEWNMGAFQAKVFDHGFGYGFHDPAGLPAIETGAWHHAALVWEQSQGVRFYLDGQLAGSTWGRQAWWDRATPHAVILEWPGAAYDELRIYSAALPSEDVAALARGEDVHAPQAPPDAPNPNALLGSLGPAALDDLLTVELGGEPVVLREARIRDIRDDRVPCWRIADGRTNLYWPEWRAPVLGDVDFSGSEIRMELEPGQRFDWVALRGLTGGCAVHGMLRRDGRFFTSDAPFVQVPDGLRAFWSKRLDGQALDGLRIPRRENMRLHDIRFWSKERGAGPLGPNAITTEIRGAVPPEDLGDLWKEICARTLPEERRVFGAAEQQEALEDAALPAFTRYHLATDPAPENVFLEKVRLRLRFRADWAESVLWVRMVEPVNPMRNWAYFPVRLRNPAPGREAVLDLVLDPWDIVLDEGRRLWIELMHDQPVTLALRGPNPSTVSLLPGEPEKVLAEFTHTMGKLAESYWWLGSELYGNRGALPDQPGFALLGTITHNRELRDTLLWILRHAPEDRYATSLWRVIWERGASVEATPRWNPPGAPEWAVWGREFLERFVDMAGHWADLQGPDGQIGGGWNDDPTLPGVFLALPFFGDERTTRMFERIYDGLEETGFFDEDGFPRSPTDALHATDFFSFRAFLMMFRYGEPRHLQRALPLTRALEEWTELDEHGGRRFVANFFGEDGPRNLPDWKVNSAGTISRTNARSDSITGRCFLRDAIFHAWYSRNPTLLKFLEEFARGDYARATGEYGELLTSNYALWPFFSYHILFNDTKYISPPVDARLNRRWSKLIWERTAHGVVPRPEGAAPTLWEQGRKDKSRYVQEIRAAVERLEAGWQFRAGEAGGANDHFRVQGLDVLSQMGLGMGMTSLRPGSIIPRIDASWEGIGTVAMPIILEGTTSRVKAAIYNFQEQPLDVAMRVWRLAPGQYRVSVGVDQNGDDEIDGEAEVREMGLQRASRIFLTLTPREVTVVEAVQVGGAARDEPMPHPTGPAPDLAVGEGDAWYDLATDRLKVRVHNVGSAAAENVRVSFNAPDGSLLGEAVIPRLDAPLDLVPKTATVWLPAPLRHPVEHILVTVDPRNEIREINEENNRIRWSR